MFATGSLYARNMQKTDLACLKAEVLHLLYREKIDPLRFLDPNQLDLTARIEFYKRLSTWAGNEGLVAILDNHEIKELV